MLRYIREPLLQGRGARVSREVAESLTAEALELLGGTDFPANGDPEPLRALTRFILERTH